MYSLLTFLISSVSLNANKKLDIAPIFNPRRLVQTGSYVRFESELRLEQEMHSYLLRLTVPFIRVDELVPALAGVK